MAKIAAGFGLLAGVLISGMVLARPLPPDSEGRTSQSDLAHCPKAAVCGSILRPLDPTGRVKGEISIAYRLYPHSDQSLPLAGTILAQEGGPGYGSTGSSFGYKQLFAPLLPDHDLLMVDARGTRDSGAILCPSVQHSPIRVPEDIGACGRRLGRASGLYGTRLAAQDTAAVLDALHIDKVDFYGDSYGTFFGQVFSALYPERLRSVVLDGAYPVIGETPWYSNSAAVVRTGFDAACARSPYCARLKGRSLGRIRKLVETLRTHPISGRAPDGEGQYHRVTADPGSIGNLLLGGAQGPVNYRDLDAAIRAMFEQNDTAPLLRLVAESDANEYPTPPRQYSYGLFAAVSCMDYQQIYDMNSPVSQRRRERHDAIAAQRARDPKIYDPLTIGEFQAVPLDISVLNLCIDWPLRQPPYPPGQPIPANADFTAAPTLVLNGELDMLTTAAEGAIVTAQYPHGRQIVVANSFHVDAIDDVDDCAQEIVRRFVATLDPGDTSCASHIKPVRLVPFFVRRAADVLPATPSRGNTATPRELSLASAAVQTAGDALARWNINYSGKGAGLRGGHWSYTQPGLVARFRLDAARWANDLPVSGTAVWDQRDGAISAALTFTGPKGETANLTATWNDRDPAAVATLSGTVSGHQIRGKMTAP